MYANHAPHELEVKGHATCVRATNQPLLKRAMFEGYTFSLSEYSATVAPEWSIMLTEPIVLRL